MEAVVKITHPRSCAGVHTTKRAFELLRYNISGQFAAQDVPEPDPHYPVFNKRGPLQRALLHRILNTGGDELNYVVSAALRECLHQLEKKPL